MTGRSKFQIKCSKIPNTITCITNTIDCVWYYSKTHHFKFLTRSFNVLSIQILLLVAKVKPTCIKALV